jgi:hypothetical protein
MVDSGVWRGGAIGSADIPRELAAAQGRRCSPHHHGQEKRIPERPVLRGLVKNLPQRDLYALVKEWRLDDGEDAYRVKVR